MRTSSFKLLITVATVLGCLLVSQVQGGLAFRTTFNDAVHIGATGNYEATGTLGDGDFVWLKAGSADMATVDGIGGGANKAIQFDENGDMLSVKRWVAPPDRFDDVDLTQAASGMSFGYWLKVDTASGSPMLLLASRSGDLPNTNDNITHGLRHNGGATPYTSRRVAMERYNTASAATEMTAGVWHHLVFTYSAGAPGSVEKEMYIDGASVYTSTADHTIVLFTSGAHRIGGYWNGSSYVEHFYGQLDQFDVWDHDLSDAEVLAEYNAGPVTDSAGGEVPRSRLHVRYLFNEFAPGSDPDSSDVANTGYCIQSQAYDATIYSGATEELHATYVASSGGGALHLDGSLDQHVKLNFPDVGDTLIPTLMDVGASFTFWVRFEETSDNYMSLLTTDHNSGAAVDKTLLTTLRKPSTGSGPYSQRRFQYPFFLPPGDQTLISANQWHHLVLTVEGDQYTDNSQTLRYYVDGVLKYTAANQTCRIGTGTSTRIGITHNGSSYLEPFTGDLDEVGVYDYKLSDAEVTALYQDGPMRHLTGNEWIRANPPLLAGTLMVQPPNWHAVDTPEEVVDYQTAGFSYFSFFVPPDETTVELAKSVDPNFPVFMWNYYDSYVRTFRAEYLDDTPVIIMRGDEPYSQEDYIKWYNHVKFLKEHYPEYLVFTNAFPATANYGDAGYLQRLIDKCDPDVLMSDRYPLRNDGTTAFGYYLDMLSEMRKAGLANDLPQWMWIQSETWVPEYIAIYGRLPSETDLRFLMFSAMTFGFTGFNFLNYAHWIVDAVINPDGTKGHVYTSTVNTNPEVLALLYPLRFTTSTGVFFIPGQPSNPVPPYGSGIDLAIWSAGADPDTHIQTVSIVENGSLINGLIGFFDADNAEEYFMISNLNSGPSLTPTAAAATFRVQFDTSINSLLRINRLTGAEEVVNLTGNELVDVLPGGTGNLYKYNTGTGFMGDLWPGRVPTNCDQVNLWGYGLAWDENNDCHINEVELASFLAQWLKCVDPESAGCDTPWQQ